MLAIENGNSLLQSILATSASRRGKNRRITLAALALLGGEIFKSLAPDLTRWVLVIERRRFAAHRRDGSLTSICSAGTSRVRHSTRYKGTVSLLGEIAVLLAGCRSY